MMLSVKGNAVTDYAIFVVSACTRELRSFKPGLPAFNTEYWVRNYLRADPVHTWNPQISMHNANCKGSHASVEK